MKKKLRQQYHYYVTQDEYLQIKELAMRLQKPEASTVRTCVLAVANDPVLEYIFDDGVLLKPSASELSLQSKSLQIIKKVLEQLEHQGISIDFDEFVEEMAVNAID
ncbi:MAG: hypothetical protein RR598_11650 [Anaerorhabdus sp.]